VTWTKETKIEGNQESSRGGVDIKEFLSSNLGCILHPQASGVEGKFQSCVGTLGLGRASHEVRDVASSGEGG
jgi:hypothetical protein